MLAPPAERRDSLDRLLPERRAVPARIDVLDIEPLELPGGPPSELLDGVRDG